MWVIQCPYCGGMGKPTPRDAFLEIGKFDEDEGKFEFEGETDILECEHCKAQWITHIIDEPTEDYQTAIPYNVWRLIIQAVAFQKFTITHKQVTALTNDYALEVTIEKDKSIDVGTLGKKEIVHLKVINNTTQKKTDIADMVMYSYGERSGYDISQPWR